MDGTYYRRRATPRTFGRTALMAFAGGIIIGGPIAFAVLSIFGPSSAPPEAAAAVADPRRDLPREVALAFQPPWSSAELVSPESAAAEIPPGNDAYAQRLARRQNIERAAFDPTASLGAVVSALLDPDPTIQTRAALLLAEMRGQRR